MKVLAVENNAELLKLLSHLLEKEGFAVHSTGSGSEAMKIYAAEKPEIACLDVLLDDLSGIEVCRRIRAQDADMPVLLITSKSRESDISEGMAAGATEYIVKPFDLAGITALMHKTAQTVLARKYAEKLDQHISFGDLQIYPARLLAKRDGRDIPLSLRDVRLLEAFHAKSGAAMTPADLAPYCWHAQGQMDVKAVEWQIGQLRRKIERDAANPGLLKGDSTGYVFG